MSSLLSWMNLPKSSPKITIIKIMMIDRFTKYWINGWISLIYAFITSLIVANPTFLKIWRIFISIVVHVSYVVATKSTNIYVYICKMYIGLSYTLHNSPINIEVINVFSLWDWNYLEDNLFEEEVKLQSHFTILLPYTWYLDMNPGHLHLGQYFFLTYMFVMADKIQLRYMWILVSRWVTFDIFI